MADVWANVVYTPKTNVNPPLGDSKEVPKTEIWEMPETTPQAPTPQTEVWEMPEPPVIRQDTTVVTGGTRLEDVAYTPQDDSWFDKLLDILDGLPKSMSEPEAEPKPVIAQPKAETKPEPKAEAKPAPKPEPKPEPKPIPAEGRTFKTQGDPLVRTADGMWFGVHEPGKYVALKSASGDFVMEQEISKTKDGRKYNTAMGFKLDNNTIAIDTNGGNGPNTMTVNGKKYDLKFAAHGIDLPGGGKVTYDPKTSKIHMTSADGDQITINRVNNAKGVNYLNAEVTLSEKRPSGSVHGLLGSLDADNDAKNDTRDRKGNVVAVDGTTKLDMNDARLWKTPEDFAKEWRTRAGEGVL
ncbi:hypothetical protein D3C72_109380 [compost metagenome]